MKYPQKSRLALAITAAIGSATLALAPVAAQAAAADYEGPSGDSATNTGQFATGFYLAQPESGWYTTVNVTNTTDSALAVKVRFKEYKNSRDALDFWVLLSPYDVWTGWVRQEGEQVLISTTDESCTVPQFTPAPISGIPSQELVVNGFYGTDPTNSADDGGSPDLADALERLRMGHFEILAAGECTADNGRCFGTGLPDINGNVYEGIGWLTKHVDGVPRNCDKAESYFLAREVWNGSDLPGAAKYGHSGNPRARAGEYEQIDGNVAIYGYQSVQSPAPLKVNVAYLMADEGKGASSQALHLDYVHDGNLIAAQNYPWYVEPTIATAPSNQLWDMSDIVDIDERITWTATMNEWASELVTDGDARTQLASMVLNFPTKGYHVDQYCNQILAGNNKWRYDGEGYLQCANALEQAVYNLTGADYSVNLPPTTNANGPSALNESGIRNPVYPASLYPFPARWANGASLVRISVSAWDREEQFYRATVFSPLFQLDFLPWEVALLSFNPIQGAFGSYLPGEVYVNAAELLDSKLGWAKVEFVGAVYDPEYADYVSEYAGLPMHGLIIKTRTRDNPSANYAQATENGYEWEYAPSSVEQP